MDYINRRVDTNDKKLGKNLPDGRLSEINYPMVILAEPGAGKTTLARQLGKIDGSQYVRAAEMRTMPKADLLGIERLIIDGLDESFTANFTDTLSGILRKVPTSTIPVLLCRSADWRSANGSAQLRGRWGRDPIEVNLLPLDENEIWQMAMILLGEADAEIFISRAKESDTYGLLSNPQNLVMFAGVWQSGEWPETKKDLFELSARRLVAEANELHSENNIGGFSRDDLLKAGGFVCAQFLLSQTSALELTSRQEFASDDVSTDLVQAAISTNCFSSPEHGRFIPCHKSIADFLAARWLSQQIRGRNLSVRRLKEIFYGGGGVIPAALRGVHAWLACLSPDCRAFIKRDPFGVLVYSDAGELADADARVLLYELKELAEEDPYFTSADRRFSFGKGLARPALKDDIIDLITNDQPDALVELIVESLADSEIVSEIKQELEAVLDNPQQAYIARRAAFISLASVKHGDIAAMFQKLSRSDDEYLLRIAVENCRDHVELLDGGFIGSLLFKASIVIHRPGGSGVMGVGWGLEKRMSAQQLNDTLEFLAKVDRGEVETRDENEAIDKFIVRMLGELIQKDKLPSVEVMWALLEDINPHGIAMMSTRTEKIALTDLPDDEHRAIVLHALSKAQGNDGYAKIIWRLNDFGIGLKDDDAPSIFSSLMASKHELADWCNCLRLFIQYYGTVEGVIDIAKDAALGDNELLAFIGMVTSPSEPPEWKVREAKRAAAHELRLAEQNRERHESYHAIRDKLEAGLHLCAADSIASAFLGQTRMSADTAEGRIKELVGENTFDNALASINATIENNDIPSARDIASLHAHEGKRYYIEFVLLAYCGQLLSQTGSLEGLTDELALSALAACHWGLAFGRSEIVDPIRTALRERVFKSDELKERYVRDTIEPYLDVEEDVQGLYQIAREPEFAGIAGRLAIEWLRKYQNLKPEALNEICNAAARYASEELLPFIRAGLNNFADAEYERIWSRLAFFLDFNGQKEMLTDYVNTKGKIALWTFKRSSFRDEDFHPKVLEPQQLFFLISEFAPQWPYFGSPRSGWSGDENPWNAYEQITGRVKELAGNLTDEAARFMQQLSERQDIPDYLGFIKHHRTEQIRNRAEQGKVDYSLEEVRAILLANPPNSSSDLQALLIDELRDAEERIKGSETNTLNEFWQDDKPRDENDCRNRLVETLKPSLSGHAITTGIEAASVNNGRADIQVRIDGHIVPIEAKGQWHSELWKAANDQLQDYTKLYGADGYGIYLVFWFGEANTKELKKRPGDYPQPQTAKELERQLNEHYSDMSPKTKIIVIDLSK